MKTFLLFTLSILWLVFSAFAADATPKTVTASSSNGSLLWPTNFFAANSNSIWTVLGGGETGVLAIDRGGTGTTNAAGLRGVIGLDAGDPGSMGTNWLTLTTAAEGRGVLGLDVAAPGALGTNLLTQATSGGVRGLVGLDAGEPGALGTNLLTQATAANARGVLEVSEWSTNSTPLVTGNHSTAAALDVDDTSGDAGLRLQYGTADYILKLYGTNLTLVSAADGSTPYYVAAPMGSAMLTYKSMTNLFVMKTNDIGLVSLATFEPPPDTNKFAPLLSIVKNSRVRLHSWDQDGDAAAVLVSGDDIDVGSVAASSVIATNLTAVVDTIAEMEAWTNTSTKTLVVNDANRGGTFIATTGLPVDNGIVFTNAMGGVFRRQYIGPVSLGWWVTTSDAAADITTAFANVVNKYDDIYIPAGTWPFAFSADIVTLTTNRTLRITGAGKNETILKCVDSAAMSDFVFKVNGAAIDDLRLRISDLTFQYFYGVIEVAEFDTITEMEFDKIRIHELGSGGLIRQMDNPWTNQTSGSLVIGRWYAITTEGTGDDFTGVGAPDNNQHTMFAATDTTPTWGSPPATLRDLGWLENPPTIQSLIIRQSDLTSDPMNGYAGAPVVRQTTSWYTLYYVFAGHWLVENCTQDGGYSGFRGPINPSYLHDKVTDTTIAGPIGESVTFRNIKVTNFDSYVVNNSDLLAHTGAFTTNKVYKIVTYVAGDDFANIGAENESDHVFWATGTTPTTWTNGSVVKALSNSTTGWLIYCDAMRVTIDGCSITDSRSLANNGGNEPMIYLHGGEAVVRNNTWRNNDMRVLTAKPGGSSTFGDPEYQGGTFLFANNRLEDTKAQGKIYWRNTIIENNTWEHCTGDTLFYTYPRSTSSTVSMCNNRISDCRTVGNYLYVTAEVGMYLDVKVNNNTSIDVDAPASDQDIGNMLYFYYLTTDPVYCNIEMSGNHIVWSTATGSDNGRSLHCQRGIQDSTAGNAPAWITVKNNTIYTSAISGLGYWGHGWATNSVIEDNTLYCTRSPYKILDIRNTLPADRRARFVNNVLLGSTVFYDHTSEALTRNAPNMFFRNNKSSQLAPAATVPPNPSDYVFYGVPSLAAQRGSTWTDTSSGVLYVAQGTTVADWKPLLTDSVTALGVGTLVASDATATNLTTGTVTIGATNVATELAGKLSVFDVRSYGAIADDAADDSAAITNAIIAAAAANGIVNIPEGTFTMSSPARFTSAIKNKRVTIQGAGKGTTVLDFSGVTLNGPVLSFTGGFNAVALPAPTTLTNGQETITFASAHGLAKADKVRILSTDVWNSADAGAVAGEFFKVVRVVSDTEVEIDHPLYDDYTVANCTLELMEPASVTLRDFTVQSYDGSSITIGSEAVSIYYGADCKIAGVEVLGAPRIAVELNHVYGVTVSDSSTLQGNEGPQTSQYGLSTDQCQDVFVRNCVLLAGRHAAKIGGNGMPSRALFYDNCRMASWYNSTSAYAFDAHGQSEYIKVSHCIIDGGMYYGGNKSEYVNNVIRVRPADGIPGWLGIAPRALNGFDFRFENNTVEVLPGSPTNKPHAFMLNLSTVADTAASDGVFIIRNNTFIGGENSYPGVNVVFATNAIPTFTFIIDGNTFQSTAASPVTLLVLDSVGNTFHGLLGKTIIRHNVFKNGYVSLSPVFQDLVFDGNSIDAGTTADYCLFIHGHGGAYPTNMVDGISMQIVNNDFRGSSFSQLRIYDTGWNGTSKQRLTIAGNTFLGPPTSTTLTASIRVTLVAGSVWNGFIADNRLFNTEGGSTTQLLYLDDYYGLLVGNNYRSDGLRVARTVGQTVAPGADGTVYSTSEATVNGNVYGLNGARLYDSYTGMQWTYYANNSLTPSTNRWNQTYPALVLPNATAPTLNADQSVIYSADYKTKATPHIVGENGIALPIALNSMSSVTAQRTSLAGTTKIVDESGGAIGNFDTGWLTNAASWSTNSNAAIDITGATNTLKHTSVTALVGPPRYVTMTLVSGGSWTVTTNSYLTVTIGGSLMHTFVSTNAPSGTMTISGMVDGTTDEIEFTAYAPGTNLITGSFDNFKVEVLAAGDFLHRHTYHAAALVKATSATAPAPYFEFSAAGTHAANGNAKDKVIALVNTTVTSAPAILATIPSTDNNGSWRLKGKVYAACGGGASDYDNFMLELDYVDGSGTYTTSLHSTDLTGNVFAWNAAGYFLIGANADTADGDVTINTSSVEYKP